MTIDLIVPVGVNADFYVKILRSYCVRLASGKHDINYKAIIGHRGQPNLEGWNIVGSRKGKLQYQSAEGHGETLNLIYDHISSDYTIICDADMVIRLQDWDDLLIDALNKDKRNVVIGVVAASIPAAPGYRKKALSHYKGFPLIFFCMFRSSFLLDIRPDFRPIAIPGGAEWKIVSKEEETLWGMTEGTRFQCDPGFRLPYEVRSRGLQSVGIPHEETLHIEPLSNKFETWYLGGKPFASHALASRFSTEQQKQRWAEFCKEIII